MSSLLPLDDLLVPISEERPCGDNLRADTAHASLFFQVRDARAAVVRIEDDLLTDPAGDPPDWSTAASLAATALTRETKDLQLAVWYTEALLRTDGFSGLVAGLKIITCFIERWWDGIHPQMNDGDATARLGVLNQLGGERFLMQIRSMPLVYGLAGVSIGTFDAARELLRIDDEKRAARVAAGTPTIELLDKQLRTTNPRALGATKVAMKDAVEQIGALVQACQRAAGPDFGPSLSALRDILIAAEGYLPDVPAVFAEAGSSNEPGATPAVGAASGSVASREAAYAQLEQIAAYFEAAEPLSPISFAIRQVVRWGRKPLPELLAELIPNEAARAEMFKLVGIAATKPEGEQPQA